MMNNLHSKQKTILPTLRLSQLRKLNNPLDFSAVNLIRREISRFSKRNKENLPAVRRKKSPVDQRLTRKNLETKRQERIVQFTKDLTEKCKDRQQKQVETEKCRSMFAKREQFFAQRKNVHRRMLSYSKVATLPMKNHRQIWPTVQVHRGQKKMINLDQRWDQNQPDGEFLLMDLLTV